MKTIISLFIITASAFCYSSSAIAGVAVLSDPDHISTGIEYQGVPEAKAGDSFSYDNFFFGGMVEIRNESRFNQGALPNHNWRGFVYLYFSYPLTENTELLKLTAGFEHESAHPTMGLNAHNENAYDKIYDNNYRNINLNSFIARLSSSFGNKCVFTIISDLQFYYYSRNTPELPGNDLTWSEGLSSGFEFRYPLTGNVDFFISGFDRYIFQSRKKINAKIYYNTNSGLDTHCEVYPIINNMNTVSAKTGLIFSNLLSGRKISIYCGILYGNIYGFIDSREKRNQYSIGVEVFH